MLSPKRYEEFAYVLDYIARGRSALINGREGPLVQAIGEERLILLELLAGPNCKFEVAEKLSIGRQGREKIMSVLGKLSYEDLTQEAKNQLLEVVETIVKAQEARYIAYMNELQPLTPRLHALELIPGIGKTFMLQIIKERAKKKFESFEDLQRRIGLREPRKLIAKRIVEEVAGGSRIMLFVGK